MVGAMGVLAQHGNEVVLLHLSPLDALSLRSDGKSPIKILSLAEARQGHLGDSAARQLLRGDRFGPYFLPRTCEATWINRCLVRV